jgi:hypothetical protein
MYSSNGSLRTIVPVLPVCLCVPAHVFTVILQGLYVLKIDVTLFRVCGYETGSFQYGSFF